MFIWCVLKHHKINTNNIFKINMQQQTVHLRFYRFNFLVTKKKFLQPYFAFSASELSAEPGRMPLRALYSTASLVHRLCTEIISWNNHRWDVPEFLFDVIGHISYLPLYNGTIFISVDVKIDNMIWIFCAMENLKIVSANWTLMDGKRISVAEMQKCNIS